MKPEEAIASIQNTPFFRSEFARVEHTGRESENELYLSLKAAVEALRKQEPKKPDIQKAYTAERETVAVCGNCGEFIFSEYRFKYCPICGQRTDRSEQEESE